METPRGFRRLRGRYQCVDLPLALVIDHISSTVSWPQLSPRKNLTSCPGSVDHYTIDTDLTEEDMLQALFGDSSTPTACGGARRPGRGGLSTFLFEAKEAQNGS